MALASISYPTDGVNNLFAIPFYYISPTHIHVYVNGVEVGFSWLNANTVQINPVPSAGLVVTISRVTPIDSRLVDFEDGTVLTEKSLDLDGDQAHFLIQEMRDDLDAAVLNQLGPTTINDIINNAANSAVNTVITMPEWGAGGVTITQSAEPPADPSDGDVWYDQDDNNKSYWWDEVNSVWQPLVTQIHGSLVVDNTIVGSKILAGEIGSEHISVTTLDAISANMGTITTGSLTLTSIGTHRIEISSHATYPLWYGSGAVNDANGVFFLRSDGSAVFGGELVAASGTFSGQLVAATGTFAGELQAATGTFAGSLTASAVNAVQSLNLAGTAVTIPGFGSAGQLSDIPTDAWTTWLTVPYDHGTYNTTTGTARVSAVILLVTLNMTLTAGCASFQTPTEAYADVRLLKNGALVKEWLNIATANSFTVAGECGVQTVQLSTTLALKHDNSNNGLLNYTVQVRERRARDTLKPGARATLIGNEVTLTILGTKR